MDTSRVMGWLGTVAEMATSGVTLVILLLVGGGYLLARSLAARSTTAYLILGGLITLILVAIGVTLTLAIFGFAHWMQSRHEAREQEHFITNAKENLAIMQMTARTQAAQNAMLLRQAREVARLPAPGTSGDGEPAGFEFDDALFEELER